MSYLLDITRLEARRAGADTFSDDDISLRINGEEVFSRDFETGDVVSVSESEPLAQFNSPARIRLVDEDSGFFTGSDDTIGVHTVNPSESNPFNRRQSHTVTLSGSGSTYELSYDTINIPNPSDIIDIGFGL